ncbi:TonB-dependent receptor [Chryseolinea sp. H1M3-3]|uniref:TonB-dependent receptor n=1 Tax=Chryseolinea sp. H1M3-3 TaxID=3034144 RepID=UPI0023EBCF23|nr:TonB-dependent receptor [Chryseolinea sp. H1M3-3]
MKSLFCLIFGLLSCYAQAQKFTIDGSIKDNATGETLIGATIFNPKTLQGTTTNTYGFYSFTQSRDLVYLRVSYVGYGPVSLKFFLSRDTTINIGLVYESTLKEIVIEGKAEDRIQESTRMGTIDVPLQQIKSLPAFLGEVDVLKVLQLLPGVQSGSEGSSGLYVRGGGPEQNLILLDGVPVYNASHLFGFFSVFNADAINRVELIKGGFPARYGGRLSSVIDINMKEGDVNKFRGEGSIGVVASRLTLEGPIIKGKTSYIVSGRRTYIDAIASPLIRIASDGDERAGYYFYDLNAKINHHINNKNRIYLSAYSGNDKAFAKSEYDNEGSDNNSKYEEALRLGWGNITTALRWNSIITNKLFSNVTATYSRYRFLVNAQSKETTTSPDTTISEFYHSEYSSGIRDFALKADLDYVPNPNHFIRFGGQLIDHRFTPGVLSYKSTDAQDTTVGAQVTHAKEFFVYAEDDFMVSPRLKINAGIHASGFVVESRFYKSLQPRVSGRFLITPDISVKGSYARMTQYIHLLSNAGIGLPTDLWVPATSKVRPEHSYLASLGAAYNYKNAYEFSVEGYYKEMEGLIEYREGADYLNVESDWQTKIETGKGNSYGAEFFMQKKTGRISGWIGYTLSWTYRKFENLNEGRRFPYRYDRRHDIKVAAVYEWRPNREFSMTWVFGSGSAVTLPKSLYAAASENPSPNSRTGNYEYYGDRNSFRMRAYHRLDVSYTTTKKTKWGERSWSIGAYNVYSRQNPFFIDITGGGGRKPKFVQYSLFPIIPSIAYRFKF